MNSPLVIAGLGNPGRKYEATRHNVGFWLLDHLAREHRCTWAPARQFQAETASFDRGGRRILLVKPQTYVNESGRSLGPFCRYYRIAADSVVVVYDELNIDVGRLKISLKGSAGGHNGLASILQHVGPEFIRFRIGIGPRHPPGIELKDFVLGKFSAEDAAVLEGKAAEFLDALHLLIDSGPNPAMNRVNQRKKEQNEPNDQKLPSQLRPRHAGQDRIDRRGDQPIEEGPGSTAG